MLLLSNEATDKDCSLKTQLLVTSNDGQDKLCGERAWKNKYLRPDLNLEKKNVLENSLL